MRQCTYLACTKLPTLAPETTTSSYQGQEQSYSNKHSLFLVPCFGTVFQCTSDHVTHSALSCLSLKLLHEHITQPYKTACDRTPPPPPPPTTPPSFYSVDQCLLLGVQWSCLHEWMPFENISRKKSREVAASLPGRFLSRRCFTLCITMEVNLGLRKQYKRYHCWVAKITEERGWRMGEKCLCVVFLAGQKIASSWKKMRFGASYSTSNRLLLVAIHILTTGLQKCL